MSPFPTPGRRTPDKIDQAIRARAAERLRQTALGPTHPAVEAAIHWQSLRRSADSAATSVANFTAFFEFCARTGRNPLAVDRHDARVYLAEQQSLNYAPGTLAHRKAILSSFFAELVEAGSVPANPFYRVTAGNRDAVTPTPALTPEQCDRLIETSSHGVIDGSATIHDHRNAVMVYLMIRVGPRRMEVADATWAAFTPAGDSAIWRVHGKGNRWAPTAIPNDVLAALDDWRAALEVAIGRRVRGTEPVFPALGPGRTRRALLPAGGEFARLDRKTVSEIFKRLLAQAGIEGPRYNAHAARATAATRAYAATRDIIAVQQMLRHRNQTNTLRYIRNATTDTPADFWRPNVLPPVRPALTTDTEGAA